MFAHYQKLCNFANDLKVDELTSKQVDELTSKQVDELTRLEQTI